MVTQNFADKVRYVLRTAELGTKVIIEPKGWRDDEKEYTRNKDYHGIFTKFSNSLKFVKNGAEYIDNIYRLYGINTEIELIRSERHPHTDQWQVTYRGFLDLSTYEKQNNEISVKFNSGGLEKLIKTRHTEKLEIERLTDLKGNPIPELETENLLLEGRRINLVSDFEEHDSPDNNTVLYNTDNNNDVKGWTTTIPIKLVNRSHEIAHSTIMNDGWVSVPNTDGVIYGGDNGTTNSMFIANSDRERTFKISFTLDFDFMVTEYDDITWSLFWIRLAIYKNGSYYNFKSVENLLEIGETTQPTTHPVQQANGNHYTITYDKEITLLQGESISIQAMQYLRPDDLSDYHFKIELQNIDLVLKVDEDSSFEQTTTKTVTIHTLFDRLLHIISGKKVLNSDYLQSSNLTVSHGHWVRGFDRLPLPDSTAVPPIENKYKAFTTTLKDAFNSVLVTDNIGLGIERIGYNERVKIAPKKYFYNRNVTVRLPNQVSNLKRTIAKEYYSGIEIGYTKGGEYDEANGLDEYNAKSTFTTVIDRVKKTYKKLSKYRADSYGKEFARRKQKDGNPTLDTKYDKDIFLNDTKQGVSSLLERKWQDDFAVQPTGIFSPETATNLRLSPVNILLKHAWYFGAGFTKYLTDYVRYASSTGNSQLRTKLIGGNEYTENGNIINSELEKPHFVPEWIEFNHKVGYSIINQLEGKSEILGETIPNFYGLVEFKNENNEIEQGYLFNLKPNKEGKWKLLKANK